MKNSLSKQEFDKLLNHGLISSMAPEGSEHIFSSISRHAFATATFPVMLGNWVIPLTGISCIGLIATIVFLNVNTYDQKSPGAVEQKSNESNKMVLVEKSALGGQSRAAADYTWTKPIAKMQQNPKTFPVQKMQTPDSEPAILNTTPAFNDSATVNVHEEYIFPVLSAKEVKANEKEKKRVVRLWSRVTREKDRNIARIPANEDNSIPAFYMGAGEITNKEYRTFLFDLLISGRKDEFLKAKPRQHLWKNAENTDTYDFLEKEYFTEKKYDYFPVVNITVQGAEMYCRWLQEEVGKLRENDPRIPDLNVRLPYEKEWMHAAAGGTPHAAYAWPLNSAQNSRNCFMGNFCVQKKTELIKKPLDYGKQQVDENNYTSAAVVLRDPKIATIDVWSYNPTSYGLFGVCGNAAEMVYGDADARIVLKGGSWASDLEEIMLDKTKEIPPAEASPTTGFRIAAFMKK